MSDMSDMSFLISIVAKGALANETVNYDTRTKAYVSL